MDPAVAASPTAVVWLTVALVTILAMTAMLIALVRHALLIGRAARRLNEEVAPLMEGIQAKPRSPRAT